MKISIIIPAYEMYGKGQQFLRELLISIDNQIHKDFEVIVADHSKNDNVEIECAAWANSMDIHHFFNKEGRGNSSINMNAAIKKVKGNVIKVMHMDDLFCNGRALELISNACEGGAKWGVVAFNHLYYGHHGCRTECGKNHLKDGVCHVIKRKPGCPSSSFFVSNPADPDYFDENLVIINDKDMHYRLEHKYGKITIIEDVCVTIRMHEDNFFNKIEKVNYKIRDENEYFDKKHGIKRNT